jgi:hypothetical protein
MNVKVENIKLEINGKLFLANLKWFRGASRYNNGGNHNGRLLKPKYPLRIIFGRLKDSDKGVSWK